MSELSLNMQSHEEKQLFARSFALWIALGAILMMFAGLTSAYIVKKADSGTWTNFSIPGIFYISTLVIILSSVTMFGAQRAFRKGWMAGYRNLLLGTLALGSLFLLLQVDGWMQLKAQGIDMVEEISGAFFYVISGAHAAHILGGLVILLIMILKISRSMRKEKIREYLTPARKLNVTLMATYWHFIGFLWIYIFLFLLYNHN